MEEDFLTTSDRDLNSENLEDNLAIQELDVDNLDQVCRVCLSREEVTSLHNHKHYSIFLLLLQTCEGSESPSENICKECSVQLQNIHNFIKKLNESTNIINTLYEKKYDLYDHNIHTTNSDEDGSNVETIIIENGTPENELIQNPDQMAEKNCDSSSNESSQTLLYICEKCNKTFKYSKSLQYHMMEHEEINKYKCPLCEWTAVDKTQVKDHLKMNHNALFTQELDVSIEKLVVITPEGHLKCNICDFEFVSSAGLEEHLSQHEQINSDLQSKSHKYKTFKYSKRKHDCKKCGKQFSSKSSLNRHILIVHEETKRFRCEICDEKFTVKNSLKYHMNIHTDTKPYKCNLCSRAFRQPAPLIRHRRTKHKEYKCEFD
ncbi:unnamed protein product [Phyllotreta striolata]|uniref:C2H2-type domain-containing protein n=1 Tax=Phyllotreta striolata TaxID=444603 RepID=A0A9N9XNW3_PHYSR|nr:unnamed protein product [Phyllotreta striolata]